MILDRMKREQDFRKRAEVLGISKAAIERRLQSIEDEKYKLAEIIVSLLSGVNRVTA